jgi:transcriptional regulator with XRE-family HTH domain
MTAMIFWGEKGEYGPFSVQKDGWPNAGEVIRHYRKKLQMSAEELARRYGEAIGEQITARWILKMEQQNKIPTDLTRRRVLMKILDIPPILLGLSSLAQVIYTPTIETKIHTAPTTLKHVSTLEIAKYEQHTRAYWLLSYTGEESLEELIASIRELEQFERQSGGALQRYVRTVLNSHYQLASDITRHRGNFMGAWTYANKAVRVTKLLGLNDFFAAALYRRGYTNLEWGVFGDEVRRGIMNSEPDRKKIETALVDFEEALLHALPQLKGAIWLELSRAEGILRNTPMTLNLLSQAEDMVGSGSKVADPIEQILLEGALNGLNEGMYLLGKAASLIVVGRTTSALELLDDLDELKNGQGIARNQTRRLAYADTLRAEAALGARDYFTAATRAISALQTFLDIHTIERIAMINTIHRRLAEKCGNHPEVRVLGKMLTDYYRTHGNKRLQEEQE